VTPRHRQHGFSLLTLSIWMLGVAITLGVVLAILPNQSDQQRIDATIDTVGEAKHSLLSFLVNNSRLPQPDTSGNGVENGGATRGALPWRSMGLPAPVVDEASIPVQYAPYRNAAEDADLAGSNDLYQPTFPDLSEITDDLTLSPFNCPDLGSLPTTINLLDLCVALDNAAALATDSSQVSVSPASGDINVAYVVVSGGLEDADGGGNLHLDGANEAGLGFDDPARGRTLPYDDILRFATYEALDRELACTAHAASLAQLEAAAEASLGIVKGAQDLQSSAETQVGMATFNFVTGVIDIAGTVGSLVGISADIGKASAGCNVPPNVLCCPALGALVAGVVVYSVTAAVQVAALATTLAELIIAIENLALINDEILPHTKINMCNVINDLQQADVRGGL